MKHLKIHILGKITHNFNWKCCCKLIFISTRDHLIGGSFELKGCWEKEGHILIKKMKTVAHFGKFKKIGGCFSKLLKKNWNIFQSLSMLGAPFSKCFEHLNAVKLVIFV